MIVDFMHIEYKSDGTRYTAAEFVAAIDRGRIKLVVLGGDQSDAGTRPAWADPSVMGEAGRPARRR